MSQTSSPCPQSVYTQISIQLAKLSYQVLERRMVLSTASLNKKKIDEKKRAELSELIHRIRRELGTTRRQVVVEDLLDQLETRLERL